MKNFIFLITFTLLLLVTGFAQEIYITDSSTCEILGFSKDGKYLAFESWGTLDAAGLPYSDIYFINVQKNSFAAKESKFVYETEENTGNEKAREINYTKVLPTIKRLGIQKNNSGQKIKFTRQSTDVLDLVKFNHSGKEYTLTLKSFLTNAKMPEPYDPFPNYLMDLSLNANGKIKVLQKDKQLPKSRKYVGKYSIQNVVIYNSCIAVVVNYITPNYFEGGWNLRQIVVTAEL